MENTKFVMPSNRIFIKFGITRHGDVADRFNATIQDGYEKSDYSDWKITIKFSMWHPTREDAEHWEKYWLNQVFPYHGPNKVWVEKILGCPTNDYYSKDTGLTELRLVTLKQAKWVTYKCNEMKKRLCA